MTSNLGSEFLMKGDRASAEALLHKAFKPEFLNRIDEIVYFSPLSREVQRLIVNKMLRELSIRLAENYYSVEFSDALKDFILDEAYSPEFGARPIKRYIQDRVETALADLIVRGSLSTKATYLCTLDKENNIVVQQQNAA
jgi:ATP-dependent Clp protease ATP-binding subunit ClpB